MYPMIDNSDVLILFLDIVVNSGYKFLKLLISWPDVISGA